MAGDTVSTLGTRTNVLSPSLSLQSPFSFAILNVGAPAAGMNAAVRSAVRIGICQGHTVYVVSDGFEGLSKGQVRGDSEPGCHGFPRGMGLGLEGGGCSPAPKSSTAACRSVRWAGTTWQAGWDAAGPCWAPSGKHSTRGARGCSRGDAAVPWDCGDPMLTPWSLLPFATAGLCPRPAWKRSWRMCGNSTSRGCWSSGGSRCGGTLSPVLVGAGAGCQHPRRCRHPKPSLLGCGSSLGASISPALGCLQAYEGVLQLVEARGQYEELCIIMCVIPATISNNVPGTDFSLGSDTAVNAAMEVRDRVGRDSSQGHPAPPAPIMFWDDMWE